MVATAKHSKKLLNNNKTVIVKGRNSSDGGGKTKASGRLQKNVKSSGITKGVKKEKKKITNAFKLTKNLEDETHYIKNVKSLEGRTSAVTLKKHSKQKSWKVKQENEGEASREEEEKPVLESMQEHDTEEIKSPPQKVKRQVEADGGEEKPALESMLEHDTKGEMDSSPQKIKRKGWKKKTNWSNRELWKPIAREEIHLPNSLKQQVHQGVSALLKLEPENKKDLLGGSGKTIFLQLSVMRVPQTPSRLIRFELPHPLRSSSSEVCLFVSDLVKGKKHDHEPTIEHVRQLLNDKGVTVLINEVIPLRQLKVEYDQYELKRSLCNRFDFFLSEAKVSGHILHCLGKEFYRKHKVPVPVNLKALDLNKEISRALSKTALKVHSNGSSFVVKVAHTGQTAEEIENNVMAAAESVAGQFPGGWDNIQSLIIKTASSLAIPVYMTLKSPNDVSVPIVKPIRAKAAVPVTDELSTIPGARVTVHPSGKVVIDGIDESDEEWLDPKIANRYQKRKTGKQRRRDLRNSEKDKENEEKSDDADNDTENENHSGDEEMDFSEEKDEKIQESWLKENEELEVVKTQKKKEMAKKQGQAGNNAKINSPTTVQEVDINAGNDNDDDEDDDNNLLRAEEDAYLSSWGHLKDVEEEEKGRKAKAGKGKTKMTGKFQARNSKKPFKNKGQVKGQGKVQKKLVKKKAKAKAHL